MIADRAQGRWVWVWVHTFGLSRERFVREEGAEDHKTNDSILLLVTRSINIWPLCTNENANAP